MEEEKASLNLTNFEFFKIMFPGFSTKKLRLPDKFARELEDRELRDAKLRLAGAGRRVWDVKVVVDDHGDMYLGRGWQPFACAHDLQVGHFLVFRFDGTSVFTVTVFDDSMCRRDYHHDGGRGSTAAMDTDAAPSQFTVTLRPCNLCDKQGQYLNVPVEFQDAHGYAARSRVVLEMGGGSWTVNLKRGRRPGGRGNRTTFRYGWHQFCVDNGLGVGDTCFFRALREGDARRGGENVDHVLKVEVRKRDGTFLE